MLHNEYVLLLMFAYFHLSDIHALYLCWDPFADGQPVEWIMWPKAIQFSLKIAQYSAWDAGMWKLYLAVLIKWGYNCKVWSVWRCSYPQHPNPLCSLPGLLKQVETYACGGSHLISGDLYFTSTLMNSPLMKREDYKFSGYMGLYMKKHRKLLLSLDCNFL